MAASTPAQEEPAQPPSTNSLLPTDSRDDSVTNDESAPLLDADDRAPPARNASTNLHYIFTSTALSSSFLTLIFIIAGTIALNVGENENWHGLPWGWSESMVPMIVPAIFSLFFSACNLARLRHGLGTAPLGLSMLCDVLVAVFASSYGITGLSDINYGPFGPAKILAGIALAIGTICGIAHMGLFALRCHVAYCSEFWKQPWSFPNGQLTLECSVKFYKEPQGYGEGRESAV